MTLFIYPCLALQNQVPCSLFHHFFQIAPTQFTLLSSLSSYLLCMTISQRSTFHSHWFIQPITYHLLYEDGFHSNPFSVALSVPFRLHIQMFLRHFHLDVQSQHICNWNLSSCFKIDCLLLPSHLLVGLVISLLTNHQTTNSLPLHLFFS